MEERVDKIEVIRELGRKKESYLIAFKEIVKIEKGERPMPDHFGWGMSDIRRMDSYLLRLLKQDEIIKCTYESNKGKWFRLADDVNVDVVEKAIQEVEAEIEAIEEIAKDILIGKRKEFLKEFDVTEEDIKEFKEILKNQDAIDYFYPLVCPKIHGMEKPRKAVLLALASHWDDEDDRWRISVLMYGKQSTGTAKTPLLRWVKELGGGYVGMSTTRSGLTVNMRTGAPGYFARFHRNVCSCDELDKLEKRDRDGTLQALEDGTIDFEAADFEGSYPAEAIILGGANDIAIFTPEQFGRWDFRFHIVPYTKEEAKEIAAFVSRMMGKSKSQETQKLGKFLKWIRGRDAAISDQVREEGIGLIQEYIDRSGNTDIRRVQAIWRVACAWARLNYSDVTAEDVAKAILFFEECDSMGSSEAE
jgi:DNA replicative helicase MCM subunit Mcm2 (Cdc46/Mcm family)